jgi:hypothetical protein
VVEPLNLHIFIALLVFFLLKKSHVLLMKSLVPMFFQMIKWWLPWLVHPPRGLASKDEFVAAAGRFSPEDTVLQ